MKIFKTDIKSLITEKNFKIELEKHAKLLEDFAKERANVIKSTEGKASQDKVWFNRVVLTSFLVGLSAGKVHALAINKLNKVGSSTLEAPVVTPYKARTALMDLIKSVEERLGVAE